MMTSTQMLKVAGFADDLRHAMKGDRPSHAGSVAAGGALGAGLGALGGYRHAAGQFAEAPLSHPGIFAQLFTRPGALDRIVQRSLAAPSLKNTLGMHGELLPAIAKAAPGKLLMPALAAGGAGALGAHLLSNRNK